MERTGAIREPMTALWESAGTILELLVVLLVVWQCILDLRAILLQAMAALLIS